MNTQTERIKKMLEKHPERGEAIKRARERLRNGEIQYAVEDVVVVFVDGEDQVEIKGFVSPDDPAMCIEPFKGPTSDFYTKDKETPL